MRVPCFCHPFHRIHAGTSFRRNPLSGLLLAILAVSFIIFLLSADEGNTEEHARKMTSVRVPDESSKQYNLPLRSRIKSIEAEMYNVCGLFRAFPHVSRFKVSPTHYDSVLVFFEHPRVDHSPVLEWPAIGSLKITDEDGVVTQIIYYSDRGIGALEYSIKGVRCYDGRPERRDYDGALTIDARLRYAHEHPNAAGTRPK